MQLGTFTFPERMPANGALNTLNFLRGAGTAGTLDPGKDHALYAQYLNTRYSAIFSILSGRYFLTTSLGVGYPFLNGRPVGREILRPGYTHYAKTKYAFTYDVTKLVKAGAGEANVFSAEVSAGWWRDKIVTPANKGGGFAGRKSAFRGVLEFTFADGTKRLYGTNTKDWKAGVAMKGKPVRVSSIVLANVDYSDVFEKAIEDKQVAMQNAIRAKNRTQEIEEEARQKIITAEAEAKSMQIRGDALKANPGLVQLEAVSKWDGKAPGTLVIGDKATPMLNLGAKAR